jgi:cytochrome c biogenesis protein CcmG, thiol:disulfide interchange protein DsbE
MRTSNRAPLRLLPSLLAAVAALWGAALSADAPPTLGQPAPPLLVPQLDGRLFDLKALRGRVVIVNFWATWCSPCRAEMPRLDAFYREYHARGVELLGLSVDERSDEATVRTVMQQFHYPAALAADARQNGFGPAVAVPMTWIIDASGIVRVRLIAGNAVTEQTLTQRVVPLLRGVAAPGHP